MNSFLLQNVGLGCSGQGMENSSGTHSSKGKLGKGSLGKGNPGRLDGRGKRMQGRGGPAVEISVGVLQL